MTTLLEVENLRAFYGPTQALFGVNFMLRAGEITSILGANGAGKTTTLRAICQTVRTSGSIRLDGKELSSSRTDSIIRSGLSHVPEGRGTFTDLSVEENLRLGAYVCRDRAEVENDIEKAYARFPILKQRRHQQAGTLSGGEQQMLAISRALMSRPRLLLLDEPSFGLAPMIVDEIFETLKQINAAGDLSILLVEQNATRVLALSHSAYLLETGRIVISGSSAEISADEGVRKSYLGY